MCESFQNSSLLCCEPMMGPMSLGMRGKEGGSRVTEVNEKLNKEVYQMWATNDRYNFQSHCIMDICVLHKSDVGQELCCGLGTSCGFST